MKMNTQSNSPSGIPEHYKKIIMSTANQLTTEYAAHLHRLRNQLVAEHGEDFGNRIAICAAIAAGSHLGEISRDTASELLSRAADQEKDN